MYVLAVFYALVSAFAAWLTAASWRALALPGETKTIGLALASVGPLVMLGCLYLAGRAAGLWL